MSIHLYGMSGRFSRKPLDWTLNCTSFCIDWLFLKHLAASCCFCSRLTDHQHMYTYTASLCPILLLILLFISRSTSSSCDFISSLALFFWHVRPPIRCAAQSLRSHHLRRYFTPDHPTEPRPSQGGFKMGPNISH